MDLGQRKRNVPAEGKCLGVLPVGRGLEQPVLVEIVLAHGKVLSNTNHSRIPPRQNPCACRESFAVCHHGSPSRAGSPQPFGGVGCTVPARRAEEEPGGRLKPSRIVLIGRVRVAAH